MKPEIFKCETFNLEDGNDQYKIKVDGKSNHPFFILKAIRYKISIYKNKCLRIFEICYLDREYKFHKAVVEGLVTLNLGGFYLEDEGETVSYNTKIKFFGKKPEEVIESLNYEARWGDSQMPVEKLQVRYHRRFEFEQSA